MHCLPRSTRYLALALTLFTATALAQKPGTPSERELRAKTARFAPTVITADARRLSPGDRKALAKIVEAARLFDPLFIRQVWSGNEALARRLEADRTPLGRARLHYFRINKGPWSQLDENHAFLDGVPATKPDGAAHYPDDMTKAEFDAWVATLSDEEKQKATGFFHAIRRGPDGKLRAVPYSEEYREFLEPAARLLREAAALTDNATLARYLTTRADAFASNDYYTSDVAWMELDAPIDVTIATWPERSRVGLLIAAPPSFVGRPEVPNQVSRLARPSFRVRCSPSPRSDRDRQTTRSRISVASGGRVRSRSRRPTGWTTGARCAPSGISEIASRS